MLGSGLDSLKQEAGRFRSMTFAASTKKTYRSQAVCFTKYCLNFGLVPVPATQETLVTYCAYLARTLSSSSIPAYLNVVRLMHIEAGFPNPLHDNWELSSMQRGISRLLGRPPKQKSPITVKILLDLLSTIENHSADYSFWPV